MFLLNIETAEGLTRCFPKRWRTNVEALILQEIADYCVHAFAVDVLMEEDEDGNDEND